MKGLALVVTLAQVCIWANAQPIDNFLILACHLTENGFNDVGNTDTFIC